MGSPDGPTEVADDSPHASAATTFARRVLDTDIKGLEELLLFGSTASGEATGLDSDVDFLAVVADDVDLRTAEDRLRDLAYDVMLEEGPVVEVHVITRRQFDRQRRRGHPFLRRALREGERYA